MIRKLLLVIFAVWATVPTIQLMDAHAATTHMPQMLNAGGRVDHVDARNATIIIDDSMLLLAPTTRVIDATGRATSIHALRRGTMVNYSALRDSNAAKPKITEITILPPGKKPKRDDND